MSEVLRAILDFNCIDSRPAFYSASLTIVEPATGFNITRRQMQISCKADTYFLVMAATQDNAFWATAGTPYRWESKAFETTFQIVRGNTQEAYSITPQMGVLQNYNLNNLALLDEYILFEPAELIIINADVRTASSAALTEYAFVTLVGVEYQMPEGKRISANG